MWTGVCFSGWLCNAIECKDTEAMAFAVAWIVGPTAILFLVGLCQARKKNKAKKERILRKKLNALRGACGRL